uniref:Ovule protein n=1 Tax=Panagrellus redivivus TaxID=6233 RepID=A0A7E4W824_PANRE
MQLLPSMQLPKPFRPSVAGSAYTFKPSISAFTTCKATNEALIVARASYIHARRSLFNPQKRKQYIVPAFCWMRADKWVHVEDTQASTSSSEDQK